MFNTAKRHKRDQQKLTGGQRLLDAILGHSDQGLFLLDGKSRILTPVSRSLARMFRREDFADLTFEKLLAPLVSAKVLTAARGHLAGILGGAPQDVALHAQGLKDVEIRLSDADARATAHYWFDVDPIDTPNEARVWLVRVTDITMQVQTLRELDELRAKTQTQEDLLRSILKMGGTRFGRFLHTADASMKAIHAVLKKPAREEDAFRNKLAATIEAVDRMRREAADLGLAALESSARGFENALQELRSRSGLSGSDFLPLAVKLDHLYGQFALIKTLTQTALPGAATQTAASSDIEARVLDGRVAEEAAAGTLDYTLQSLTEHMAQDHAKQVVLESRGLSTVPGRYQAAIKNVAIQLIRNAVMHGIETPQVREAGGKSPQGTLRLEFTMLPGAFELTFEDDGCGLDPVRIRATAVRRGILTDATAAGMRDRDLIKLIFKSRFTTLPTVDTEAAHGAGLSLVRRHIHEAGGKIALASLPGRQTRFKITLPPLLDGEQSAAPAAAANVA